MESISNPSLINLKRYGSNRLRLNLSEKSKKSAETTSMAQQANTPKADGAHPLQMQSNAPSLPHSSKQILQLQKSIGNQAVMQMLKSQPSASPKETERRKKIKSNSFRLTTIQ